MLLNLLTLCGLLHLPKQLFYLGDGCSDILSMIQNFRMFKWNIANCFDFFYSITNCALIDQRRFGDVQCITPEKLLPDKLERSAYVVSFDAELNSALHDIKLARKHSVLIALLEENKTNPKNFCLLKRKKTTDKFCTIVLTKMVDTTLKRIKFCVA